MAQVAGWIGADMDYEPGYVCCSLCGCEAITQVGGSDACDSHVELLTAMQEFERLTAPEEVA